MAAERNTPNFVTYTTAVQLKIKEIITQDLTRGVDRQTTFKKLKQIISKFSAKITDELVRQQFERSLARGAVKLYEEFSLQLESVAHALAIPLASIISLIADENGSVMTSQTTNGGGSYPPMQDVTHEYLYEDKVPVMEMRKKLKAELARLMAEIADTDIKDRKGASLRNLAEMHVRRDYQQASIEQMRATGVKLVWASTHPDCSPRCLPWQGKLYSLDGTSGTTATGVRYQPLEVATNVQQTTRAGKTYKNGLLGFNCRHRLIPYNDEQVPPKGYTREQAEKAYRLNMRQRNMEREIRRLKERAHLLKGVGVDDGAVSRMFARARDMTVKYRKFCRNNDLVAMVYRTQVTIEEQVINQSR